MDFSFEIVDMDGRRVDKVLVTSLVEAEDKPMGASSDGQNAEKQGTISGNNEEDSRG